MEYFAIHVGQGVFIVRTDSFCDVIPVPSKEADWLADGGKVQAELDLTAEPDVIPDDAIFTRVGATFPGLLAKKKRAGLDRHVPIGIDGAGDGNLVEEIKEI